MLSAGGRVLVAISGGADSVALLHILRVLQDRRELTIAGLGHLNHQLRGAEADADEAFCRGLAAAADLAIEVGREDVMATALREGRSLEDAARVVRYRFLEEAAGRRQADVIAVGHSLDDQAETFLLRLTRGAGSRGLGGIRPRAGRVIRPLLEISRADLRLYLKGHGLEFRDDASNLDVRIPRNRIRKELIPSLEQYAPGIVPVLARQAQIAREDEEYLERIATEVAQSVVLKTERGTELQTAALLELPRAIASRVVRQVLELAAPGRFIAFGHIDGVLGLARGDEGAALALPGLVATRVGHAVVCGKPTVGRNWNTLRVPLSIPGEAVLGGWTVEATRADRAGAIRLPPSRGPLAVVAARPLGEPLTVRTRRKGDRFRPLGMGGRGRKLQDFLTDRKVPRTERDSLPLVVDRDDRIVWVAGHSVAEDFRVTAPEEGVILLKARRLGGLG